MSIAAMLTRTMGTVMQRLIMQPSLTRTIAPAAAAVRYLSGRSNCLKEDRPRCDPKKNLCKSKGKKDKKKKGKKKKKAKSMWLNPECCLDPCPDVLPRFDDLYYRASNKAKRKYTQTWVECPKIKIAKRKICCFENIKPPPFKRRPRKKRRTSKACDNAKPSKHLMKCRIGKKSACPKIKMPGCRAVRDPPRCKRRRMKSKCRKVCTPYPSFSECQKPKPRPRRPIECRCLDIPALCEVYAELRRRQEFKH